MPGRASKLAQAIVWVKTHFLSGNCLEFGHFFRGLADAGRLRLSWPVTARPTRWRACLPPPPPHPAGAAPWGGAHARPRAQQRSKGTRLPRSRKRGRSSFCIEAWRPTSRHGHPATHHRLSRHNFSPRQPRVGERVGARRFDVHPWDTQIWTHFRAVSRE